MRKLTFIITLILSTAGAVGIVKATDPVVEFDTHQVVQPEHGSTLRPQYARSQSQYGCTANWNTESSTVGFSAGDIWSPYRSCAVAVTWRRISGQYYQFTRRSAWLNDYEGPIFMQPNLPGQSNYNFRVVGISIQVTTSYL